MAKVVMPLLSAEARGKVADSLVFFPLPHAVGGEPVRVWVIPGNPQTSDQGDVRLKLLACGTVTKKIVKGKTLQTQIAAVTPANKIWNAYFVEVMVGKNFATIDGQLTEWGNLSETNKGYFNTAAAGLGLETSDLAYAAIDPITGGMKLFIAAHAAYTLGLASAPADAKDMTQAQVNAFATAFTS